MKTPYTYFIKHKETGYFYYGVKYGKDTDTDMFWIKYFTSSKIIKEMIKKDGKDSFDISIRKTFKTPVEAMEYEMRILRRIINHPKCLNNSIGGNGIKSNKNRNIVGSDGLNSYQRAGKKISLTLKNNHEIIEKRTLKAKETMLKIDPVLNINRYKKQGLRVIGDLNPSKRPEVRKKISDSTKKYQSEHPVETENRQKKVREILLKKDETGLNVYQKSVIKREKNGNGSSNYKWINNGIDNKRIRKTESLPEGYRMGRINMVFKKEKCPHCGLVGSSNGMRRYHFDNCKKRGV